MDRRQRWLVAALVLFMASLVQCAESDAESDADSDSESDDEPDPTTTVAPTATSTVAPTEDPTVAPTEDPTVAPTEDPTVAPTGATTVAPTDDPTAAPTSETDKPKEKCSITTQVRDITCGKPGAGILVCLSYKKSYTQKKWKKVGKGVTDKDGKVDNLVSNKKTYKPGLYRLKFTTAPYFEIKKGYRGFFPCIKVVFHVKNPFQHYHIPLLLSNYGYSTYLG